MCHYKNGMRKVIKSADLLGGKVLLVQDFKGKLLYELGNFDRMLVRREVIAASRHGVFTVSIMYFYLILMVCNLKN